MRIARVIVAGALALLCIAAVAQETEQPADVPAQDDTTDLLATEDGESIDAYELWW